MFFFEKIKINTTFFDLVATNTVNRYHKWDVKMDLNYFLANYGYLLSLLLSPVVSLWLCFLAIQILVKPEQQAL